MTSRTIAVSAVALAIGLALVPGCGQDSILPSFGQPSFEEPKEPTLSMTRTDWHAAAKPAQLGEGYVRGQILWHTPRYLIPYDEVYDREAAQGEGAVRLFRMIFRPRHIRTDTTQGDSELVIDTVATGLKSWAGITSYLGESGYYIHDTTQHFEIRARGSGRLHIEFGRISEDINGDGLAANEDGVTTNGAQNGVCEEEEDVGLDLLSDQDEPFCDPLTNPDPNGDNWFFMGEGKCPLPPSQCDNIDWDDESVCYEWLNGTEGNLNDPAVQGRPDAEKLSNHGFQIANSYFSYVIDFASDSFRVPGSNSGSSDNQWWTYRIPFRDSAAIDQIVDDYDEFDWRGIRYARIWFEDQSTSDVHWDTVEIADWRFLQNGILPYDDSNQQNDSSFSFIRDYEFAAGRIFDLVYPGELSQNDAVLDLVVYEAIPVQPDSSEATPADMFVEPRDTALYPAERVAGVIVEAVDPSTYSFYNDSELNRHYVVFNREMDRARALGAYFRVSRSQQHDTLVIGDLSGDTLKLRLLRRPNGSSSDQSWQLMWRNCYSVDSDVPLEDVDFSVWRGPPGAELSDSSLDYQEIGGARQSYIQILGLDQYNMAGQKYPDGRVDDRVEIYRPDWGLLIFPEREPFNSTRTFVDADGNETMPLADTVPEIYDSTYPALDATKYFIRVAIPWPPAWW